MAKEYKNFQKGIGLIPKSSSNNDTLGDLEVLLPTLTSTGKIQFRNETDSSAIVTETHPSQDENRLKNKDLEDLTTAIVDSSDFSKKIKFEVQSSHASSTTTLTLPDTSDTLVARNTTDTLTNKTIDLSNNTLQATSAQIASAVSDEIGSGLLVFNNTPTLITPTINTINNVQQINNNPSHTLNISSDTNISLDIGATTGIAQVNSSGLTIGNSKEITFNGLSNSISINAPSISSTYTISLPSNSPATNTALFYDGSNYIWYSVATAKKTKYDVIVGSVAEVASGYADYSSLQSAVSFLSSGGSILISSNYSTVENITVSTNSILIEGQGYMSKITGNITYSTGALYNSLSNLRITGNITLSSGADYNNITNFWCETSSVVTDNGTSNYILGIKK